MIKLRRICRTCQHWNETVDGDCLSTRSPMRGRFVGAESTCSAWKAGIWTRPKPEPTLCSVCSDPVKVSEPGWRGVTHEQQRPWLRAARRVPLCDGCGHVIWAGEIAWYKRVSNDDVPREMLGMLRKVKECAGFLRRAALGGLQHFPYQGEK